MYRGLADAELFGGSPHGRFVLYDILAQFNGALLNDAFHSSTLQPLQLLIGMRAGRELGAGIAEGLYLCEEKGMAAVNSELPGDVCPFHECHGGPEVFHFPDAGRKSHSVARKAGDVLDQDDFKGIALRVGQHSKELCAVFHFCAAFALVCVDFCQVVLISLRIFQKELLLAFQTVQLFFFVG